MYKRVIIKISGEALSGDSRPDHFQPKTIARLVKEINDLPLELEIALVVGGGNIWRGRDAREDMDKTKAHQMGMLATVINGIYLSEAFRIEGGRKATVMTPYDMNAFTVRYSKEIALSQMSKGIIPIFAGGTGHPFFSTDSIVAIRACEMDVDVILYGKSIDCVYDKDPKTFSDSKRYKTVSYKTVISNNLSVADISAISLTSKENIPSIVFALDKSDTIVKACQGNAAIENIGGTFIDNDIEDVFY